MTKTSIAVFFVALISLGTVSAFPSGPPTSVCTSMLPSHGVAARSDVSPYRLSSNVNCFSPGSRVLLTLRDPLGASYTGLFVQARVKNAASVNSFGTFDVNGNSDLKTINCFGGAKNSLGHSNAQNKLTKTFGWTSPLGFDSDVVFTYVVAKDYSNFWANVQFDLPYCVVASSVVPPMMSSTELPLNSTQVSESPNPPAQPTASNPIFPLDPSSTHLASNFTLPSEASTTTTAAGSCVNINPAWCRRQGPKNCKKYNMKSKCCLTCSGSRSNKDSQSNDEDSQSNDEDSQSNDK